MCKKMHKKIIFNRQGVKFTFFGIENKKNPKKIVKMEKNQL